MVNALPLDEHLPFRTQEDVREALRFHRGVLRAGRRHPDYAHSVGIVCNLRRLERFITDRHLTNIRELFDIAIADVAHRHGVSRIDIIGDNRQRPYVNARSELVCTLREPPYEWSYPMIGKFIKRDHTTVISLHRRGSHEPKREPMPRSFARRDKSLCWCGRSRDSRWKTCQECRDRSKARAATRSRKPAVKRKTLLVETLFEVRKAWVRLDTVRQFEAWLYEATTAAVAGADEQMTQEDIDDAIVEMADRIQERRRVESASKPHALRKVANG